MYIHTHEHAAPGTAYSVGIFLNWENPDFVWSSGKIYYIA